MSVARVRLVIRGLLPGGPKRVAAFLQTLACTWPLAWPKVVEDWIVGLAIRNYIDRHFGPITIHERRILQTTAEFLRQLCATAVQRGTFAVSPRAEQERSDLLLVLRGYMDGTFYLQAPKRLEKLLRTSRSTITLYIEELANDQRQQLERLLERLSPFGDRVSIWVSEHLRGLVAIDSSVFNLVLGDHPDDKSSGVSPA